MAYICYKSESSAGCKGCPYFRYDTENNQMACFAQQDKEEVMRNDIREAAFGASKAQRR